MSAQYKISLPDGNEYMVNDLAELQRLYRQGQVTADVLVQPVGRYQWYPLKEFFNLSEWETFGDIGTGKSIPRDTVDPAAAYYGHGPSKNIGLEKPSIRGMRAAGILLFINALIVLTSFAYRGFHSSDITLGPTAPVVAIMDVIVGIALVTGHWRAFSLVRLGIGVLGVGGRFFANGQFTTQAALGAVFQLIFLAGFAILLSSEVISLVRTILGVATVGFAWVGISIVAFVFSLPTMRHNAEAARFLKDVQPYAKPDRQLKDVEAGITMDLPEEWLMLKTDNPFMTSPHTRMVIANSKEGALAILIMQYLPSMTSVQSVDDYISSVEENVSKGTTSFKEITRSRVTFGNDDAERVELAWERDKNKYHGWRTVCKRGDVYYMLSCRILEGRQDTAFVKYKELESRFTLTTFSEDQNSPNR
ncbi:MAG TPA: hypothetical protein VFC63_27530 [Blastocatellia bacterium]|nr:hypothetical protein [Blastocatellia bacterium]